jgi:predicted AAA+ superfamily ATPase
VKQPSSFTRLANVVSSSGKKISTDTVIDYLSYLNESWLIFPVENYLAKLADKESNKKYYFIDNGILNLFLFDSATALLENQVAIGLRRLYGNEFYYFKDDYEVDFFLPEQQTAIQVSYSLNEEETRRREINALVQMSKRQTLKKCLLITKDDEEIIREGGLEIEVVPVWKWLLNAEINSEINA